MASRSPDQSDSEHAGGNNTNACAVPDQAGGSGSPSGVDYLDSSRPPTPEPRNTPSPTPPPSEKASRGEKVESWFENQDSPSGPPYLPGEVPHSQYTNGVSEADGTSSGQTS